MILSVFLIRITGDMPESITDTYRTNFDKDCLVVHLQITVEHKMLAQLKLNEKYWFNEMQTG